MCQNLWSFVVKILSVFPEIKKLTAERSVRYQETDWLANTQTIIVLLCFSVYAKEAFL